MNDWTWDWAGRSGTHPQPRSIALTALRGVGDATLGQWEEWTGRAFHIRRRLTREDKLSVGDVQDIRGTEEAARRLSVVSHLLPAEWTE